MFEVKVYDSFGNLKNVISVDQLNTREDIKSESPSVFQKNKKPRGPSGKFLKNQANERYCSKV